MLKIISTEQFEMEGTNKRFIHTATVHDTQTLREYIYFYDTITHKKYVEEITGGKLQEIPSNDTWNEMVDYGRERQLWPQVILKN